MINTKPATRPITIPLTSRAEVSDLSPDPIACAVRPVVPIRKKPNSQ